MALTPKEHLSFWRSPLFFSIIGGGVLLLLSTVVLWSPWKSEPSPETVMLAHEMDIRHTTAVLSDKLSALEANVHQITSHLENFHAVSAGAATDCPSEVRTLARQVALLTLNQQMATGTPFDDALSHALDTFKGTPAAEVLSPLLSLAEQGIPTPLTLIELLNASLYHTQAVPLIETEALSTEPSTRPTSWWQNIGEKLKSALSSIIRIRHVDDDTTLAGQLPTPDALQLAMSRALAEDRLQDALDMAARLPDRDRQGLTRWVEFVRYRQSALAILEKVHTLATKMAENP